MTNYRYLMGKKYEQADDSESAGRNLAGMSGTTHLSYLRCFYIN